MGDEPSPSLSMANPMDSEIIACYSGGEVTQDERLKQRPSEAGPGIGRREGNCNSVNCPRPLCLWPRSLAVPAEFFARDNQERFSIGLERSGFVLCIVRIPDRRDFDRQSKFRRTFQNVLSPAGVPNIAVVFILDKLLFFPGMAALRSCIGALVWASISAPSACS